LATTDKSGSPLGLEPHSFYGANRKEAARVYNKNREKTNLGNKHEMISRIDVDEEKTMASQRATQ
jgi:hypothetical protein